MKDIYRNLTLYKIEPKTPCFVLTPKKRIYKKWVSHETTKRLAFTILQKLPNEEFGFDNSFIIINSNHYLVAVSKEKVKLFTEA